MDIVSISDLIKPFGEAQAPGDVHLPQRAEVSSSSWGYPTWMVYNENQIKLDDNYRGTPDFRNTSGAPKFQEFLPNLP